MAEGVSVVTLGCRLNAFESDAIRAAAARAGARDLVVVNTCAVTAEAERQARQAIRRARRERPAAHIVATGCAAQIRPQAFAAMPEVNRVLGNADKLRPEAYAPATALTAGGAVGDIEARPPPPPPVVQHCGDRARALLQVQNGCDHSCTFCVIPQGRGPGRSLSRAAVRAQARALLDAGVRELVLTGVDIASWGRDLPGSPRLGALVRDLLWFLPARARLRLSSLDPAGLDEGLWAAFADDERLLPHLHLSLQAGDDLVLKRMKRRHTRADAVALCQRARRLRPDVAFGADLIAGFPTESDAAFANTLAMVGDCGLAYLHVFPYSPRPGTPAARMPQVPPPVRRGRAARLRALGAAALAARLAAQVGRRSRVLVEQAQGAGAFARADDYAPVQLHGGAWRAGTVAAVRYIAAEPGRLVARAA